MNPTKETTKETTKEIKGILPIVSATFANDGSFDRDSFRNLVCHLLQTGVQGITLFGLASEFYKLTDDEKTAMLRIFLEETGRHPSVSGVVSITDHSREVAVRNAKIAAEMGADSLMILPPFFMQPSEQTIMSHILEVASSVSIPVIIQYAPSQTGIRIAPDVFIRLRDQCEQIQWIKVEVQPPGKYISQLLAGSRRQLGALVGYAGIQMPDAMDRGAVGVQPGCSFPEIYVELYRLYVNGEKERFSSLFNKLLPYIAYWMQGIEQVIKTNKTILHRRGIIATDYCRAGTYTFDSKEFELIDQFLEEFKEFLA